MFGVPVEQAKVRRADVVAGLVELAMVEVQRQERAQPPRRMCALGLRCAPVDQTRVRRNFRVVRQLARRVERQDVAFDTERLGRLRVAHVERNDAQCLGLAPHAREDNGALERECVVRLQQRKGRSEVQRLGVGQEHHELDARARTVDRRVLRDMSGPGAVRRHVGRHTLCAVRGALHQAGA